MLDVLELDAVRAPDEDSVGVRRIDDVGDLEAALLGFPDVLVGRLDAEAEMVEQGPLGLFDRALDELHVGIPGFQAAVLDVEAQLGELRERRLGIGDAERDVVEVVGDPVVSVDEREGHALRALELDATLVRPLDREVGRQLGQRLIEVEHPQADARQRARGAVGLGREQCQLPAASVAAHERELVRAVDHVHAEPVDEEVRQLVAVGDPEGDVVKRLDLHAAQFTHE